MQAIFKNENERRCSGRTDSVDIVLYIREISRHLEREYIRGFKFRNFRVWKNRKISERLKEGI